MFVHSTFMTRQQHTRHSPQHWGYRGKKDKDPCWPRGDRNAGARQKQVNALINKVIIDGYELGRISTGVVCWGDREGAFLL